MAATSAPKSGNRLLAASLLVALGMAAVVGTALGFEHLGGYIPCKLCLEQRVPYYAGIPLALAAAGSAWLGWPSWVARLLLALAGIAMLATLGLGVYHAGVEWHWWAGPTDCGATAGNISGDVNDLLGDLTKRPPACDQAAGRFLGLSFAGWNVLAAAGLAVLAFAGAARRR